MMSLQTIRFSEVVGTQYAYRLRAYADFFNKLIIFQLISIGLSLNPNESIGMGVGSSNINIAIYSPSLILMATILWSGIMGAVLAQKQRRTGDFRFVGNQLSLNLADVLFLLTASIIAGLATVLSNGFLKIILAYVLRKGWVIDTLYEMTALQWVQGTIASILYILLFGSLGYWVAAASVMRNRTRNLIGGVAFVMFLLLGWFGQFSIFEFIYEVYFNESVFWLFIIKMFTTIAILLGFATLVSHRQEVR